MIKFLCIRVNELPKIMEANDLQDAKIQVFTSKDELVVLHKMQDTETNNDDAALIGYSLDNTQFDESNESENRLLYRNYDDKAVGGVIKGPFIIVGLKNNRFVSLNEKQIANCKKLYGAKSISELKTACGL